MPKTIRMRKSEAEELIRPYIDREIKTVQRLESEIEKKYAAKEEILKLQFEDRLKELMSSDEDIIDDLLEVLSKAHVYNVWVYHEGIEEKIHVGAGFEYSEVKKIVDNAIQTLKDIDPELGRLYNELIQNTVAKLKEIDDLHKNSEAWRNQMILEVMVKGNLDNVHLFDPNKKYLHESP